jgi:hypothetical protein
MARLFSTGQAAPKPGSPSRPPRHWPREVAVLAAFIVAGIIVTWPRATYLAGRMPASGDQALYVWSFWWVAHQIVHLGNPWFTSYLAAPVGIQLGFDTLMPLLGAVMAPVTLIFGPAVTFNLLAIVLPGLTCYAMYRVGRLWLPGLIGPIAAGAFFGLSGMLAFQDWYHLNIAAGTVFLPVALEAAVRLRRRPRIRQAVGLGLVIGACVLVNQESAVMAALIAGLVLADWLIREHTWAHAGRVALAAAVAAVVASPQLIAMAAQAAAGGDQAPPVTNYVRFAAELPGLFAPSTRLARYGLGGLTSVYHQHTPGESLATFGLVLTLTAALGLVVAWKRRSAKLLGLLWLGSAALALGPTLYLSGQRFVPLAERWHGLRVSLLMPYTWLIRIPGLSSLREADRLAIMGLAGAALLAGAAVEWLSHRARPVIIVIAVLGLIEAGWPGKPGQLTVPTALPAVDRPIAADHSGSIVVDVQFGIRGLNPYGKPISPLAMVLATADGHPRAVSYTSWATPAAVNGIRSHAFYRGLVAAQEGQSATAAQLAAARQDLRRMHVGWVLVWRSHFMELGLPESGHVPRRFRYDPAVFRYLADTGLRLDYQAEGVAVYRP